MFDKILRLGKETAIYGLSTIVGRLLNFLIVPFYANVLLPSENGIVSNLYAYIAFAFVIYCCGMEQAFMRFVSSAEKGDKRLHFSIPFISLFVTSFMFSVLLHLNSREIAELLGLDFSHHTLIQYSAWILFFDTLAVVPFASMRMEHNAKQFVTLKIFNISVNLILNIVLILYLEMRADGVFLANLLASGLTFLFMLTKIAHQLRFKIDFKLYKDILKFGLPFIPAGLAGIAMQVIDRPIVRALTDDATLGIYQLNYRLGIFMMLIVGMFDYAWRPFFLNHARDPDAKQLFSKVFTLFCIATMTIFIVVSLFIEELVRIRFFGKQFFPPVYLQGVEIVPWILLAYVFTGVYLIFVVGVYIEKKTQYIPIFSATGALVNIAANFILIPKIGILGAAISTLLSYLVMALGMYFTSQTLYRIEYEWNKVLRVIGLALCLFAIYRFVNPEPMTLYGIFFKVGLVLIYLGGVYLFKIIDSATFKEIKVNIQRVFASRN